MARKELAFQKHIINSYKFWGGYAKKWASDLAVGNPDLACKLPDYPFHYIEVKHRPTWDGRRQINNPMTEKQKIEMKKWHNAGVVCALGVVTGDKAINSALYYCNPHGDYINESCVYDFVRYVPGKGFNMPYLVAAVLENQHA